METISSIYHDESIPVIYDGQSEIVSYNYDQCFASNYSLAYFDPSGNEIGYSYILYLPFKSVLDLDELVSFCEDKRFKLVEYIDYFYKYKINRV